MKSDKYTGFLLKEVKEITLGEVKKDGVKGVLATKESLYQIYVNANS